MADFDTVVTEFKHFAAEQGYPPSVLWTSRNSVRFWRRRFFVLVFDPEKDRAEARASFNSATARNIGVAIEAMCKSQTFSICRVYTPIDDADAQHRMIPATGAKMSATVDPLPAVVVRNRLLWWIVKRLSSTAPPSD